MCTSNVKLVDLKREGLKGFNQDGFSVNRHVIRDRCRLCINRFTASLYALPRPLPVVFLLLLLPKRRRLKSNEWAPMLVPFRRCRIHVSAPESLYRGADKSLTLPTCRCILFDGENISFDASLFVCIYMLLLL
jgi:hypothetical protein